MRRLITKQEALAMCSPFGKRLVKINLSTYAGKLQWLIYPKGKRWFKKYVGHRVVDKGSLRGGHECEQWG